MQRSTEQRHHVNGWMDEISRFGHMPCVDGDYTGLMEETRLSGLRIGCGMTDIDGVKRRGSALATDSSDGGTLFIAAADGTDLSSFTSRMEGHSFSGLVIAHITTIDGNHIIRGSAYWATGSDGEKYLLSVLASDGRFVGVANALAAREADVVRCRQAVCLGDKKLAHWVNRVGAPGEPGSLHAVWAMEDLAVARSQLQSSELQSRVAMDSVAGLMTTAGLQRGRVLALVATLEEQGGRTREVWKKFETLRSSRTSEVRRLALAAGAQQQELDEADDAD